MPQRGRPPQPGTAEEKAAIRREKVRLYVKAHRERKKNAAVSQPATESASCSSQSPTDPEHALTSTSVSPTSSDDSSADPSPGGDESDVEEVDVEPSHALVKQCPQQLRAASSTAMMVVPRGNKEVAYALIGTFRGQFLPKSVRVPNMAQYGSELVTPCSAWITNAYKIAMTQDSGALRSSLLAVGLALTATRNQDSRLKMAALDVYRRALRQVRNDLKPLTAGSTTNYLIPYLSCLSAAMFEMIHDGFSENIQQHVKGAISLMELLPKDIKVDHLLGDLLLEDLCMWEIVFALTYRYPSPLRLIRQQKGRRNYKVAGDIQAASRNATVLGDLLDCADEIPTVMSQVDALSAEAHSTSKRTRLEVELDKLVRIGNDLDLWAVRFRMRFGPLYVEVKDKEDPGMTTMQFVSYEVAAGWVYCLTFQICGIETNIEALVELLALYESCPENAMKHQRSVPTDETSELIPDVGYDSGYQSFLEPAGSPELTLLSREASRDTMRQKYHDLRAKLRSTSGQLLEALRFFIPIPKGIIGQSLVMFPMDRVRAMTRLEMARLDGDLMNIRRNGTDDSTKILRQRDQVTHCLDTYKSLEQMLREFGMPPVPES